MAQPSLTQNHSQASYSVTCLVEARKEYEARILRDLSHAIYTSLKQLFVDAQNYVNDNTGNDDSSDNHAQEVQVAFQQLLAEIPKWNSDVIGDETEAILRSHPHTPKLFKKIIHANAQILASMSNGKRFQISVPPFENFVHTVFKSAAELFQDTYSFVDEYGRIDRRNHVSDIKQCISDALKQVTPIQDFLGEDTHTATQQAAGEGNDSAHPEEEGTADRNEDMAMEQKIQQMKEHRETLDGAQEIGDGGEDEDADDENTAGGRMTQDDVSSLKHVKVTRDALHDNPHNRQIGEANNEYEYEEEDDDF